MLVIISDLHLIDGTIGVPVAEKTFSLFASRLRELAYQASWRSSGKYKPVDSVDILLLGDILDPLQSTGWLQRDQQDTSYIRPWHDPRNPLFARTLGEITRRILKKNAHAGEVLRRLAAGEALRLPPANRKGEPDFYTQQRIAPRVRIHYMVGNHDWYYHLPGQAYDEIRRKVVEDLALSNSPLGSFPHDAQESGLLTGLCVEYGLVARHGDIFDGFSYNRRLGRDAASLSDIYSSEVIFRFPLELERRYGREMPPAALTAARELTNVRPLLAAPLWLQRQLRSLTTSPRFDKMFKDTWNDVVEHFMALDEVRAQTRLLGTSELNALRLLLMISKGAPFKTISEISAWLTRRFGETGLSLARRARREVDILQNRAHFVVYGHTHNHEVVVLDGQRVNSCEAAQVYINTGAWGTYHNLEASNKTHMLTCIALYRDGERGGRKFENWWANFS
jgi:UDP-2,3-diacylglucosamine pyrophosphatase LpxH